MAFGNPAKIIRKLTSKEIMANKENVWSMWNLWRNIIKKTEIRFSNDRKRDISNSIFKNKKFVSVLVFLCAAGRSLAYPLIKLGYLNLNVASDDLGSKININNKFSSVNISSMFWYIQSADCL